MNLKHFKESEFDNWGEMNLGFLELLDQIRSLAAVPFHITSDFRTPEKNKKVGGIENSLHLYGKAVDFVLGSTGGIVTWDFVSAVMAVSHQHGLGFELILYKSHIHLGLRGSAAPSKLVVMR